MVVERNGGANRCSSPLSSEYRRTAHAFTFGGGFGKGFMYGFSKGCTTAGAGGGDDEGGGSEVPPLLVTGPRGHGGVYLGD